MNLKELDKANYFLTVLGTKGYDIEVQPYMTTTEFAGMYFLFSSSQKVFRVHSYTYDGALHLYLRNNLQHKLIGVYGTAEELKKEVMKHVKLLEDTHES